jgi:hypothetical protein
MKRRSWLIAVVIVAFGLVAGAAIAGRSGSPAHDVVITTGPSSSSTSAAATSATATVATPVVVHSSPTVADSTTTVARTTPSTTATIRTSSAKPTSPVTTVAATSPVTTAPTSPVTTAPTSPVTTNGAVQPTASTVAADDRGSTRVVVANANGRFEIARRTARRLQAVGYAQASFLDSLRPRGDTVVFVRPGFEAAGRLIATALGLAPGIVEPIPPEATTSRDADADVILVLGADWTQ